MRVAVVGTGSIGKRHLANLLLRKECIPFAVSDFSKKKTIEIDGHKIEVVHSYNDALKLADVIFICNPSSMHLAYLEKAVSSGKHVYLEKPVAPTSQGFGPVIEAARTKNLIIAVGTQFRFNPLLVRIKQDLEEGRIGEVINVFAYSGEHIADYHPGEDYRTSYAARKSLGGGILLTQIHQLDYLQWLFGEFNSVLASEVAVPELEIDVESSVTYSLRGDAGFPVTGHLNYVQRPKRTGLEIIGTRGTMRWDYENSLVSIDYGTDKFPEIYKQESNRNKMFIDCHENFFNAIKKGEELRSSIEGGVRAVKIVEAIKRAIVTKNVESIG